MAPHRLKIHAHPTMRNVRMVLGFSGWMNGGEVSTGTIETLVQKLDARPLAEIDSEDFYIFSFPGSMEVSSLFRPYTKIEEGLITAFQGPANTFFYSEPHNLILFVGKEPNFKWPEYGECMFSLASQFGVSMIYFIGSVAGLVPHTREPRLFSSVSDPGLKPAMQGLGARFSSYEGPASISTYLTRLSSQKGIPMANLVAEIPPYVQGKNHRCIEAMTRRLAGILNLHIELDDLRALADRLEERLNEAVQAHPELLERIQKLEEDYDNEVFDTQMGDLKDWLERKGIRLD
ncbi:MAG: hypothetical protein AMJ81_04500 [Phycisphaerae bacterium SM23_33]|nr:MAG: hypothetical protein AMJ81_04500 [Phycisphaerae bacterium SM23_33]